MASNIPMAYNLSHWLIALEAHRPCVVILYKASFQWVYGMQLYVYTYAVMIMD